MELIFNLIIKHLQRELPADEFQRWIVPLKHLPGASGSLNIQVPNIFHKIWINDHYAPRIRAIMSETSDQTINLELVTKPVADQSKPQQSTSPPVAKPGPDQEICSSGLTEKYTFVNYVVGSSNQLAHAAALTVASQSTVYNPLFFYGGSGLGKTHLLNAIGNHLLTQNPDLKVIYRSSEQFTNELIEAIQSQQMNLFRQKYRQIDALLIDDIHFIGGKERTQEEFFYTFNALYERQKQIVLSSDRMPKEIPDLEDRLRSRFEGGLFADISPPDQETKVAILSRKAADEGIDLSQEVCFFLASQKENNIRVLEGYLARLGAYSSLSGKSVDLETAHKLLELFIEAERKQLTLDLILKVTAEFYHIKIGDLKSARKNQNVAVPRQAAMYLARQLTNLSTIEIGQRLGGRDHSTVIHAVRKVETKIQDDKSFARSIRELEKAIRFSAANKEP